MPTITIRDLPEPIHEELKRRATTNRRSLNSEIVYTLEQALTAVHEDPQRYLEKIRAVRARTTSKPLSDDVLRSTRESGRP